MKKRTSIKIKGSTYKYKYCDDKDIPVDDGIFCSKNKLLYIANQPERPIEEIYIHEELHAVLHESGIIDLDGHFEHVIIENLIPYIIRNFKRK